MIARPWRASQLAAALTALLILASVSDAEQLASPGLSRGMTLESALQALNSDGYRISYSSAIVRPSMTVAKPVTRADIETMLRELLTPWKLQAVKSGDGWVITRVRPVEHARGSASADPPTAVEDIERVNVTASRYSIAADTNTSDSIDREDVKRTPHLMDDAIRVLKGLPGVSGGDFSAQLNIRGGRRDEVMLMVDGAEIHNGFHFSEVDGLLSVMDTNLVDRMEFITGGMTADWADHMSGVVNIDSISPSPEDSHKNAVGISFISAFARNSGTFADGKGSWLFSARRGYMDLLVDQVQNNSEHIVPRYEDVFSHASYRIGSQTNLSAHVLYGADHLNYSDKDGAITSNGRASSRNVWLTLDHDFTDRLHVSTTISNADVSQRRKADDTEPDLVFAFVRTNNDFTFTDLRQDWSWIVSGNQLLRWGLNASRQRGQFDYDLRSAIVDPAVTFDGILALRQERFDVSTRKAGAYASYRYRITPHLTTEVGLRADEYRYPHLETFRKTSPRINAVYQFDSGSELRAAWGTIYQGQNVNDLQVEDGATDFYAPERVTQSLLGFIQPIGAGFSLRLDLYQKDYDTLHPRYENAVDPIQLIPEATIDRVRIDAREARSRGAELTIRREQSGNWGGYLSYGYSKAEDREPDRWRARSWDQRHNVSAGYHYSANDWSVSLTGLYHSGFATTEAIPFIATMPDNSQRLMWRFGERNAARFPAFLRIDARIAREAHLKSGDLSYYFEVINLLGRQNVCCVERYYLGTDRGSPVLDTDYGYWLPRLPSFGFQFEF